MTVASIQLSNGDTVAVEFGNDDGTITQAEIDDAMTRLANKMGDPEHPGVEFIDDTARVRISEKGTTIDRTADTLVRNGAVRLFGNNPMRPNSTGTFDDNPAMWHPVGYEVTADGTHYTIYREVDRWDPVNNRVVEGRTVGINATGGRYRATATDDGTTFTVGVPADHFPSLPFLGPRDIDGLSAFSISRLTPPEDGPPVRGVRVNIEHGPASRPSPLVSRDWVYEGTVTENNIQYYYWHDPRDPNSVARTRVSNPASTAETGRRMRYRAEGETEPSLHVSMWVCPNDTALVPTTGTPPATGGTYTEHAVSPRVDPLTLRLPNGTQTLTLTPLPQTVHVVNGQPVLFDEYTASTGGANPTTTTLRRRHGASDGWETGSGANWTAIPATAIVSQAALPVVTVGMGADAVSVTLTPTNPPTSGNYDTFTGGISGNSTVLRFRRRHGVEGAPIEVMRDGNRGPYVSLADYGNPAARPVRVAGGGGAHSAPRPVRPNVVY